MIELNEHEHTELELDNMKQNKLVVAALQKYWHDFSSVHL